jgi:hypothetical protein
LALSGDLGVAARRYFAAAGEAGAEALLIAAACAVAGGSGEHNAAEVVTGVAALLARHVGDRASLIPPSLVTGAELLQASGRAPGPWVGVVLAQVRAAQIEGAVSDHDAALRLALELVVRAG